MAGLAAANETTNGLIPARSKHISHNQLPAPGHTQRAETVRSYRSDLFGTLPSPSSLDELFPLLNEPLGYWNVRMWRGQGDIAWPIHSTAYRRLAWGSPVSEEVMRKYEKDLLLRAEHKGFRFYDGRGLSDFELLARLRHHGAATRFIDATRNALIGLWFCISDQKDKVGVLVGIDCQHLGGYEGRPEKRSYDDALKDLLPVTHPQTWEPPCVTVRVAAQHSQFLYGPVVSDTMGSLPLPKQAGATLLIAIPPSLKEHCERVLAQVYDIRSEPCFQTWMVSPSKMG